MKKFIWTAAGWDQHDDPRPMSPEEHAKVAGIAGLFTEGMNSTK